MPSRRTETVSPPTSHHITSHTYRNTDTKKHTESQTHRITHTQNHTHTESHTHTRTHTESHTHRITHTESHTHRITHTHTLTQRKSTAERVILGLYLVHLEFLCVPLLPYSLTSTHPHTPTHPQRERSIVTHRHDVTFHLLSPQSVRTDCAPHRLQVGLRERKKRKRERERERERRKERGGVRRI